MTERKYDILDVTADIGIIAYGNDIKSLFENAAVGMFGLIVNPEKIKVKETIDVTVKSDSLEDLLVAWLNELLFVFETKEFIMKDCRIKDMNEQRLIAKIKGEHFNPEIHPRSVHIKAATYHDLEITKNDWGLKAKVIFDV